MFIVVAALGMTQTTANAQHAPQNTPTSSSTPTTSATPTETTTSAPTPTPTLTPTTDPCPPPPEAPKLIAPANKKTVNTLQVKLRWSSVPCATKYRFLVRRGSVNGDAVQRGKT